MTRKNKRGLIGIDDAIIRLDHALNEFCFHDGGGDENCNGCVFSNNNPCPLASFDKELVKHLSFMK